MVAIQLVVLSATQILTPQVLLVFDERITTLTPIKEITAAHRAPTPHDVLRRTTFELVVESMGD